jgi:hypothetical protein
MSDVVLVPEIAIDDIEVMEEIGKGSTGEFFRALLTSRKDPTAPPREVCAKVVADKFPSREAVQGYIAKIRQQVVRAQRTLHVVHMVGWAALDWPNEAKKITEYEVVLLMEMALLHKGRARTLRDEMSSRDTPVTTTLRYVEEIAAALEAIHPTVHGSVSPDSILIMKGDGGNTFASLCGFVGRVAHEAVSSRSGIRKESEMFMAPELRSGAIRVPTVACDVFALGRILSDLLRLPGASGAVSANSAAYGALNVSVNRAVEKDPTLRPSAMEIKRALQDARGGKPLLAIDKKRQRCQELLAQLYSEYGEYRQACSAKNISSNLSLMVDDVEIDVLGAGDAAIHVRSAKRTANGLSIAPAAASRTAPLLLSGGPSAAAAALPSAGQDVYDVDISWTRWEVPQIIGGDPNQGKTVRLVNANGLTSLVPTISAGFFEAVKLLSPSKIILDQSLKSLLEIPAGFLDGCELLQEVDLSVFSNATAIGGSFLARCTGMCKIDLSPLKQVTLIHSNFLQGSGVLTVDLRPLAKVQTIESGFLESCSQLTHVDTDGLGNVETIGDSFLRGCMLLETVNLSTLRKVISVGDAFCRACPLLQEIDMSYMVSLTSVGKDLFRGNAGLKSCTVPRLTGVGGDAAGLMCGCTALEQVDLSFLPPITAVGSDFLKDCAAIQQVDLRPLSNAQQIGDSFLHGCGIRSVNLRYLANATSLGTGFLQDCTNLEILDLSALRRVQVIGSNFLKGCRSLTNIDLSPLAAVTILGASFMDDCSKIQRLSLVPLWQAQVPEGKLAFKGCNLLRGILVPPSLLPTIELHERLVDRCQLEVLNLGT